MGGRSAGGKGAWDPAVESGRAEAPPPAMGESPTLGATRKGAPPGPRGAAGTRPAHPRGPRVPHPAPRPTPRAELGVQEACQKLHLGDPDPR